MNITTTTMDRPHTTGHRIVSRERWLAEREALLAREKELTRLGDQLAHERRALPWVRIDKPYVFDTPRGPRMLAELFDGRRQLLVQHFMFAPGWEQGCKSCSFMADHHEGARLHLAQRDVTLLVHGSDFNHDFGVHFTPDDMARGEVAYNYTVQPFPLEEAPGISVFWRDDDGTVFHTYSRYGRGVEVMMGTYHLLDLTPKGRDEEALAYGMEWVRHHDRYEQPATARTAAAAGACCSTAHA
jgi:predicted dithiol-disulfide oxidoreductase (DUF899 family)